MSWAVEHIQDVVPSRNILDKSQDSLSGGMSSDQVSTVSRALHCQEASADVSERDGMGVRGWV